MADFLTDGYEAPVGNTYAYPRDIAPPPWHVSLAYAVWYMLLNLQASIHTGTDVSMEPGGGLGQLVYAVANGIVRTARDITSSSWRNLIVIEHTDPDGTVRCIRYGHLLAFAPGIEPGVWVRRGQVIGAVGNANGLFYPHLHFDIARSTLLVNNPTNWPGDNLSYVYANYDNPEAVVRDEYPMADNPNAQVIGLLQQCITILGGETPTPNPNPYPDPDPDSIVVIVKNNLTNIRQTPSTAALVLFVVDAGVELHVLDAKVTANGHQWYKVSGGQYDGGFIAQDVVSPKI